jgi:hypothetical protein
LADNVRTGVVTLCLTCVTSITAAVVLVPRPAAADEVSGLRAEAAQVAREVVVAQLQIGGFEQQYELAAAQVAKDTLAVRQTQDQVTQDEHTITSDRVTLRRQAIADYTNLAATTLAGVQQFFEGGRTAAVKDEYEQVARGNVENEVDQLRGAETTLQKSEVALQSREAADQAETSQAAQLTQHAQDTQAHLELLQSQVNGQLAVAVAQQQAAEAAAVAAAVRARQTATAAAVTTDSGTVLQVQVLSDPVLPPFLDCVRQAESGGNYGAVSPGGTYMGAFQFSQATWNQAARLAGLPGLVGVPPNKASRAEQDTLALAMYSADGEQPWYDPCRYAGR